MKKLKTLFLAATLGIAMLPCFSGEAYTYDMIEVKRTLDNPEESPELKKLLISQNIDINNEEVRKGFESLKASGNDEQLIHFFLDCDIRNVLATCQPAIYEDANVKVFVGYAVVGSHVKKMPSYPENSIRVINASLSNPYINMSKYDFLYTIVGLSINIVNKTNEVMEIDLGKSSATVNNTLVPLYDNKAFVKMKNLLRPRIVAPNDSLSEYITFITTDTKANFKPHFFLLTDTEIMGTYTLVINNKEISFPLSAIFDSSKLSLK